VTDDKRELARAIIKKHASQEGATLPILHALQHEFGYVPEETLPLVAEELNLSRAEVYGVATFYHDFHLEPGGKHKLTLCRAEACQARGGAELAEQAKSRLGVDWGETTPNGQVTLEPTFCLGLCACAPAGMVDGKLAGRLTSQKLDAMLAEVTR
jgi:formate dehydrogenase subunit gamma